MVKSFSNWAQDKNLPLAQSEGETGQAANELAAQLKEKFRQRIAAEPEPKKDDEE